MIGIKLFVGLMASGSAITLPLILKIGNYEGPAYLDRGEMIFRSGFSGCAELDDMKVSNNQYKLYLCPSEGDKSKPELIFYSDKNSANSSYISKKVEYLMLKDKTTLSSPKWALKLEKTGEEIVLEVEEPWMQLSESTEQSNLVLEKDCSISVIGDSPQWTYSLSCNNPWKADVTRGLQIL